MKNERTGAQVFSDLVRYALDYGDIAGLEALISKLSYQEMVYVLLYRNIKTADYFDSCSNLSLDVRNYTENLSK
jgi:hypothetical protein